MMVLKENKHLHHGMVYEVIKFNELLVIPNIAPHFS